MAVIGDVHRRARSPCDRQVIWGERSRRRRDVLGKRDYDRLHGQLPRPAEQSGGDGDRRCNDVDDLTDTALFPIDTLHLDRHTCDVTLRRRRPSAASRSRPPPGSR